VQATSRTLPEEILGLVRQIDPACVRAWFSDLQFAGIIHGTFIVRAANIAQKRHLAAHARAAFTQAAQAATGRLLGVEFEIDSESNHEIEKNGKALGAYGKGLSPEFQLDRFAIGQCNRFAHATATAVAADPGNVYNPLVIMGESGCGKTHLLQGICAALSQKNPDCTFIHAPCGKFVREVIEHAETDTLRSLQNAYRNADVVAIDDVDELTGRRRSQEEFFHILEHRLQSQRQVVVSLKRIPAPDGDFEARLISRFNAGLSVTLESPCLDTRTGIIRELARRMCIELPDDAASTIAHLISGNGHQLQQALTLVDQYCQDRGGVVDGLLTLSALDPESSHASIHKIIDAVAAEFNVAPEAISKSRSTKTLRTARGACVYLSPRLTGSTLAAIADSGLLGGMESIKARHREIVERLKTDSALRQRVIRIADQLTGQPPTNVNILSDSHHNRTTENIGLGKYGTEETL